MAKIETNWDVIVIGSGLGGLTAATRMSKAGLRVLVLEQHVFAGGYAHHFLRKVRGTKIVYDFDVALHQTGDLIPGRNMHRLLSELGVLERIGLNRFEIAYRTRGPAHDLQIPADADAYESLLCECYPEHAGGVRDLFATLRKIDGGGAGEMSAEAMASMGLTLQELIEQHVRDERIAGIFSTLWGYVGLVPSKLSAFSYAMMWCSFHFGGCFYIKGGGQALSDTFVSIIEENHGKVLLNTEVTGIVTEAGRVVGVETAKRGSFRASAVVSNAAAPLTFEHLLDKPQLAETDRKKGDSLPIACSIHQAYVGIRGDAAKLGLNDRGGFINPTYDMDAEWAALERGDYRSQGWLLGNHNLADPGHAPAGRSILHVATLADGRLWSDLAGDDYLERKRDLEEYFIDRLAESIPDVRERIEICETGTPHTMERYSMNPLGSIYGYAFAPDSHSIHRPQPRTSVPGLYLAGAWTFPGAGFTGTMISGNHTAGLVFEDIEGQPAGGVEPTA
ncbi:MAG: NAD(P)/FAD-dependent oxidoreductase [Deltaproteobacteria bacterium]|nr:NAD(P)/FAD-dependent oxidoreductase [Deltaproteobacteria bacterium]